MLCLSFCPVKASNPGTLDYLSDWLPHVYLAHLKLLLGILFLMVQWEPSSVTDQDIATYIDKFKKNKISNFTWEAYLKK